MYRKALAAALCLVTVIAAQPAGAMHEAHGGRYIAANTPFVIWCGAHDHDIVNRTIQDYLGSSWFPLPDESFPQSSEAECAHADVANAAAEAMDEERTEWGYGGFNWKVPSSARGTVAVVSAEDDLSGPRPPMTAFANGDTDTVASEGCGPQLIVLPLDLERHWTSTVDDPIYMFWALIPNVFVNDDLEVCLGSTGWVSGSHGA